MAKKKGPNKLELIRTLTPEQIMKAVDYINGDGHTVFKLEALTQGCGWPEGVAKACCEKQKSDGSYKGSIWSADGKMVEECWGWYSLDLLAAIAYAFNLEAQQCLGRGFQARAYDFEIRKHFKQEKDVEKSMLDKVVANEQEEKACHS